MRRSSHAFTLIELLVVIAIIGVLAALLTRTLAGAVSRAQEASCKNNLRQISTAMLILASDNRPWPAPASLADSYFGAQRPLIDALHPYLKGSSNVLFCPRSVRLEKLNIKAELHAGRIGYFYWAWKLGSSPVPLRMDDRENVWLAYGWNPNLSGMVLLTDRFRDKTAWALPNDWQFHAPPDVEKTLSEPGTLAVLSDGSVHKIAPRP